jgi:hypothetical protein
VAATNSAAFQKSRGRSVVADRPALFEREKTGSP